MQTLSSTDIIIYINNKVAKDIQSFDWHMDLDQAACVVTLVAKDLTNPKAKEYRGDAFIADIGIKNGYCVFYLDMCYVQKLDGPAIGFEKYYK